MSPMRGCTTPQMPKMPYTMHLSKSRKTSEKSTRMTRGQSSWLKYVHGYNLHEIAKMLGISLFCAQKADQRAKQNLKNLYENGGSKR